MDKFINTDDALPPLFEMDNFSSCIENEKNIFCNIQAKLEFSRVNQSLMEFIKNLTANNKKFDRNIIHRGLCITKDETQNSTLLKTYSKQIINKSIKNFSSTYISEVEIVSCTENNQPLSYYDDLLLVIAILVITFIVYATVYERRMKNGQKSDGLVSFSLLYNWRQRTLMSKNTDFQKLLSMQGLRFFLMMGILFIHVLITYSLSFMTNPVYYEKIMNYLFTPLVVFIVLPFFLLSSWLLILQIFYLIENHGEMSLKNVGIIILNRYFRLSVIVAVSVFIMLSSLLYRVRGPLTFTTLNLNAQACSKHWLNSLIFLGNFNNALDICNSVSWYLSADFQIYVINVLALYIKFKLKLKDTIFYTGLILGACTLHGLFLYANGNDIIFTVNVRQFEESNFRTTPNWVVYYTSTYSVWGCSIIGLILGTIYHKTKKITFKNNTILTIIWAVLFVSLPILALLISSKKAQGLEAAFYGSIVKPMFNLGFGIGILGMSHNIGGFVKRLFEYKYFVLLGNFTFCTYIVHMFPLVTFHSLYDWPWTTSLYQIVQDFILLSLACWPLGIFLTLVVEEPGLRFQKIILPQIKKQQIEKIEKIKQK